MEEDIKILKGINAGVLCFAKVKECERYAQAIENILNRLEQDEKVIKEMAKWINDLGCIDLDINKDIIDHFRKKCE